MRESYLGEKSTSSAHLTILRKMKEIIIRVDESAYECVLGMLKLCQKVEVVSEEGCVHTEIDMDSCIAKALNVLHQRHVFRYTRDISYIMAAMNEEVTKGLPFFYSPMEFIAYLQSIGYNGRIPQKSTIYNTINITEGKYPNWSFSDNPTDYEKLRRTNIVRQFLSALMMAKSGKLEG